jgi:CBS domain-containing protein
MMTRVPDVMVSPSTSIGETMEIIDEAGLGIALVADEDGRLIDTVTDGDIRRSLLAEASLDSPVETVVEHKEAQGSDGPVVARGSDSRSAKVQLLENEDIDHLPILDEEGRVQTFLTEADLERDPWPLEVHGVVMAGGFGTRLRPLTEDTPKPMLEV